MAEVTHIINWTTTASKSPLTVVTEPESIMVGDRIKVLLFSAYPHNLISPYNGLGSKTIASNNKPIDEVIELSGSSDIATKYPIKLLVSLVAAIPLVDEASRTVVVQAGAPCSHLVAVINQQLKILNADLKLHGSIRIVYETFDAQVWTHNAFANAGKALLFAHNLTTNDYENVPLSISARSNTAADSIKIAGYPNPSPLFSYTPYAHFIIFPANKNPIVKADFGEVLRQGDVSYLVEKESITFNGKEANAAFVIDKLRSFTGFFFDGNGHEIKPSFRVSEGILKADCDCYGTGYLKYATQGTVYAYNAEKTTTDILGGGVHIDVTIGTVFAFDRKKIGIAASYDIPLVSQQQTAPVEFCRVYTEYLVQDTKSFEIPPNFPTDNIYPSNPTGDKPDIGATSLVLERTHIIGNFYSGGGIDTQTYAHVWLDPFANNPVQPDAVFKIRTNIPDDADAYTKQLMNEKIDKLKAEYGIA